MSYVRVPVMGHSGHWKTDHQQQTHLNRYQSEHLSCLVDFQTIFDLVQSDAVSADILPAAFDVTLYVSLIRHRPIS